MKPLVLIVIAVLRWALIGSLIVSSATFAKTNDFIISRHQNSKILQPCVDAVSKAYQALGIKFNIIEYPGRRALYMANSGQADAELCRIQKTEEIFKQLIRVEPAIHQLSFHAITRDPSVVFSDISDIKNLRIGSIRGMMAAELILPYENVLLEKSLEQAVRILENHTVDVIILAMADIEQLTAHSRLNKLFIHQTPLYQLNMYHFVHQKHQDLIPKLSEAFTAQQGLNNH